jgi:hypothetical protein
LEKQQQQRHRRILLLLLLSGIQLRCWCWLLRLKGLQLCLQMGQLLGS